MNFPICIELNVTELCDMTCSFCPRSVGYPNSNLNMSLDTLDVIINHAENLDRDIIFHLSGRGEPTLHPKFSDLLDRLDRFKVKLSTNGNRVDRYLDKINKLMKVDYSIYDQSKLTSKQIHSKYNFHVVDKRTNTKNIYNNRAGSIVSQQTEQNPSHPKYKLMCEKPFHVVYINYNGDYNLCCNEWFNPTVLENVHTQSIKEYLNDNVILKSFQKDLMKGERKQSPCKGCNKQMHPKAVDFLDRIGYNIS